MKSLNNLLLVIAATSAMLLSVSASAADTTTTPPTEITISTDGTWSSTDGASGAWTQVGDSIQLNGNSATEGETATLQVLEPGASMTGNWQSWSVTDPNNTQGSSNVYLEAEPVQ